MKLIIDAGLKAALKPELARLNAHLETLASETGGFLGDLRSYVLINSGKRIRPALVMLASRLGNPSASAVQTVAMAVELIHIATLVHDDVIDKAAMRRNQKTVAFEHGVDAAVLLGDHIYTYAFEQVAALGIPEIVRLLAGSTSLMCAGEINQLKKRFHFDLTEEEYFSFLEKKTASLFGASARAGAILGGQNADIQDALERYALHLGMAFQVTDDLLDLTGDESVVGKTLHTDLLNGKMTLPLIHYRDLLNSDSERQALLDNLRHPNGNIESLIERIQSSGAMDYAEKEAQRRIQLALDELNNVPAGEIRDHLTTLAEILLRRKA